MSPDLVPIEAAEEVCIGGQFNVCCGARKVCGFGSFATVRAVLVIGKSSVSLHRSRVCMGVS